MATDATLKLDPATCPHDRMCHAYNPDHGGLAYMFCADCQSKWTLREIYRVLRNRRFPVGGFLSPVMASNLIGLADKACDQMGIPAKLEMRPLWRDMVLEALLEAVKLSQQVASNHGALSVVDALTAVQDDLIVTMARSMASGR